jgi:prefoldin subunit 5
MFVKQIDQELEMLYKEVLQSFALCAKAKKTVRDVSEKKGKEVQRPISAKDVEGQVRLKSWKYKWPNS